MERGPNFQQGDRIVLRDTVQSPSATFSIEPTTGPVVEVDLNMVGFADRAAAVQFVF